MTAFVERLVQRLTDVAPPIENKMSDIVAGVLETTAARLARYEAKDGGTTGEDALQGADLR